MDKNLHIVNPIDKNSVTQQQIMDGFYVKLVWGSNGPHIVSADGSWDNSKDLSDMDNKELAELFGWHTGDLTNEDNAIDYISYHIDEESLFEDPGFFYGKQAPKKAGKIVDTDMDKDGIIPAQKWPKINGKEKMYRAVEKFSDSYGGLWHSVKDEEVQDYNYAAFKDEQLSTPRIKELKMKFVKQLDQGLDPEKFEFRMESPFINVFYDMGNEFGEIWLTSIENVYPEYKIVERGLDQKYGKEGSVKPLTLKKMAEIMGEQDPTPEEMAEFNSDHNPKGIEFETEDDAGEDLLDNPDVSIWWEDIGVEGGAYDTREDTEIYDEQQSIEENREEIAKVIYGDFAQSIKTDIGVDLPIYDEDEVPLMEKVTKILVDAGCGVYNSDSRTLVWYPQTLKQYKKASIKKANEDGDEDVCCLYCLEYDAFPVKTENGYQYKCNSCGETMSDCEGTKEDLYKAHMETMEEQGLLK